MNLLKVSVLIFILATITSAFTSSVTLSSNITNSNRKLSECNSGCKICEEGVCTACIGLNRFPPNCECETHFYPIANAIDSDCHACHFSCIACTGPSEKECVSCNKHREKNAEGICECSKGYTERGLTCEKCRAQLCDKCAPSGVCTKCKPRATLGSTGSCYCASPYTTVNGTCELAEGFYLNASHPNGYMSCGKGCLQCVNDTFCLQCEDKKMFLNQTGPTSQICACPDGLTNRYGMCKPCHRSCKTCENVLNYGCTSCLFPELNFTGGECKCKLEEYIDFEALACKKCDSECETCSGPGPTNCTKCADPAKSISPYGDCGCPAGKYFSTVNHTCLNCTANCFKCDEKNPEVCELCNYGYKFNETSKSCECGNGYFRNETTDKCQSCHISCGECKGPSPKDCTKCPGNSTIKIDEDDFDPNLPNITFECKCIPKFFLQDLMKRPGLDYHGPDPRDDKFTSCIPCTGLCLTCDSRTACTSCINNTRHDPYSMSCNCVQGYFQTVFDYTCYKCNDTCLDCIDFADNCMACKDITMTPVDGKCVCKDGFYFNNATNKCEKCHPDCSTCRGPTALDCVLCSNFQFSINSLSLKCECPILKYYDTKHDLCRDCHSSCLTCVAFGPDACTSCRHGVLDILDTYDVVGRCKCTDGQYEVGNGVCGRCHPECATCYGPTNLECITCRDSNYTVNESRICGCPPRTFENTTKKATTKCINCNPNCKVCNSTKCLECDFGFNLVNGYCYCPDRYYFDMNIGACQECDVSCSICSGYKSDCLTCSEDKEFVDGKCKCKDNKFMESDTGICRSSYTPEGYFLENSTQKLLRCPTENCRYCNNTFAKCFQCADGYLFLRPNCVKSCPLGFVQFQNSSCLPCPVNCLSCKDQKSCNLCKEGFKMNFQGICFPNYGCSHSEYFDNQESQCKPCHPGCKECYGPGLKYCLDCKPNEALEKGKCIPCEKADGVTYDSAKKECIGNCGDGVRKGHNEECDDGNNIDGDGCSSTCKVEPGFRCDYNMPDQCEPVQPPEAKLEFNPYDARMLTVKFNRKMKPDHLCNLNLRFHFLGNSFKHAIAYDNITQSCKILIEPLKTVENDVLMIVFKNAHLIEDVFDFELSEKSFMLYAHFQGFITKDSSFFTKVQLANTTWYSVLSIITIFIIFLLKYRASSPVWVAIDFLQFVNVLQYAGFVLPQNLDYIISSLDFTNLTNDTAKVPANGFEAIASLYYVFMAYGFLFLLQGLGKISSLFEKFENKKHVDKLKAYLHILSGYTVTKATYMAFVISLDTKDYYEMIIPNVVCLMMFSFSVLGLMKLNEIQIIEYFKINQKDKNSISFEKIKFLKRAVYGVVLMSESMAIESKFILIFLSETILIAMQIFLGAPKKKMTITKTIVIIYMCYNLWDFGSLDADLKLANSWTVIQVIITECFLLGFFLLWEIVENYPFSSILKYDKIEIERSSRIEKEDDKRVRSFPEEEEISLN